MFYIQIPFFNLDKTYATNQSLSWRRISDGKYIITHKDKIVCVEQRKNNFTFSCSEYDFYNTWYEYFDLGTDYMSLHYLFRTDDEIKPLCVRGSGIHILKQDFLQCIITGLICSVYKDVSKSKDVYDSLLKEIGKKRKNSIQGQQVTWYEFPSLDELVSKKNKLLKIKLGILKKYLFNVFDFIDNDFIDEFKALPINDAEEYLECIVNNDCFINYMLLCYRHDMDCVTFDKYSNLVTLDLFGLSVDEFYDYYVVEKDQVLNSSYIMMVLRYCYLNKPGEVRWE